jgi:hypothetical protein
MLSAMSGGWSDGPDEFVLPFSSSRMIARCNGDLSRVAKLATQSTALIAERRDPDAIVPNLYPWAELPLRQIGPPGYEARHSLRAIGQTNIIFDRDEEPITQMVEEIRAAAEVTGSQEWMWIDLPPTGSARTGDDTGNLTLQIADVTAGYASDLIWSGGLTAVAMRFRFVLYNGEHLTIDEAVRLDKMRAAHRDLLARYPVVV